MTIATRLAAVAVCASLAAGVLTAQAPQTRTDEYTRYELLPPETSSVKIMYEVSATTAGARTYEDHIPAGAIVSNVAVHDMMTGDPLKFAASATNLHIELARPVPPKGQARI